MNEALRGFSDGAKVVAAPFSILFERIIMQRKAYREAIERERMWWLKDIQAAMRIGGIPWYLRFGLSY